MHCTRRQNCYVEIEKDAILLVRDDVIYDHVDLNGKSTNFEKQIVVKHRAMIDNEMYDFGFCQQLIFKTVKKLI